MPLTNDQLAKALKQHSPNRGFPFPFGGYDNLVMDDGQAKPPLAELEAAWLDVVAAETAVATTKAQIIAAYEAMKAGTGTTAERASRMEKAICYIAKNVLHLVP